MRYAIRVPTDLSRLIARLHPQLKRKLRAALADLQNDAKLGKALTGGLAGYWSLRIGKFRLIYRIATGRRIELLAFGPRSTIYEETTRLTSTRK